MVLDFRSDEYRRNPYPIYRQLRQHAPVCRVEPFGYWAVARYEPIVEIIRNPKLFSSAGILNSFKPIVGAEFLVQGESMLSTDPSQHTRLRSLVNRAFTPNTVVAAEGKIRALSRELIQNILNAGDTFDLVADLAMPLPITVISELLGVDLERRDDFKRWSDTLVTWRNAGFITDPDRRAIREREIVHDTQEMVAYFDEIIAKRRKEPTQDLISALVHACDADQKLSSAEVVSFIRLLLVAGNETTTNLIGNLVIALIEHPAEWQKLRNDLSLIPNLVEEALRYDSPVLNVSRRATADTEILGTRIAKDEIVMPLIASGNHDEAKFSNPENFDISRNTQGQLAFGGGIHFCLGAPLARLEAKIVCEEMFKVFHSFEHAEDTALEYLDAFSFRGVKTLPLRYSCHETRRSPQNIQRRPEAVV